MDCKESRKLVLPFIRGEIDADTMEDFLRHIENCPQCRDELEIYYTVETGLKQLDSGKEDFNLTGALRRYMGYTYQRLHIIFLSRVFVYTIQTLVIISVLAMLLLQIRIWIRPGL